MNLLSGHDVWIVVVKLGDHLAQTLCKLEFLLASDRNLTQTGLNARFDSLAKFTIKSRHIWIQRLRKFY